MPRPGPRTTPRYSHEFKATAVKLSQIRGVAVGDVAESLCIHPFMLSRWRKQAREGLIVTKGVDVDKDVSAELKALRKLKREYERLKGLGVQFTQPPTEMGPVTTAVLDDTCGNLVQIAAKK